MDSPVPGESADEIAAAIVQALARQDPAKALGLGSALAPLVTNRISLQARLAAWMAQAHQMNGNLEQALEDVRSAIALAQQADEPEATAPLRALKAQIVSAKAAMATAQTLPLPDTELGQAVEFISSGDLTNGARLARQARIRAQSEGNYRDEVFALLALARIPGQEDSAIRAAADVADESNDKNLVTAVAQAARSAKIELPRKTL